MVSAPKTPPGAQASLPAIPLLPSLYPDTSTYLTCLRKFITERKAPGFTKANVIIAARKSTPPRIHFQYDFISRRVPFRLDIYMGIIFPKPTVWHEQRMDVALASACSLYVVRRARRVLYHISRRCLRQCTPRLVHRALVCDHRNPRRT